MRIEPVFLFDLDGTLVDSVYQHVLAWKEALDAEGIELLRLAHPSQDRHERGAVHQPAHPRDRRPDRRGARRAAAAGPRPRLSPHGRPYPPAARRARSSAWLTSVGIAWAIATSGRMETAAVNLEALGVDPETTPVVTRDLVKYAKPDPDLFLAAAVRLERRLRPRSWSATASGTCWRPRAAGRWASGFSAAATAPRNCRRRLPSASTRTRPTSWPTSTSSAGGRKFPCHENRILGVGVMRPAHAFEGDASPPSAT